MMISTTGGQAIHLNKNPSLQSELETKEGKEEYEDDSEFIFGTVSSRQVSSMK
jgi:hypothetical protein